MNYKNKFMLAPMVRVGTLPMRLLALQYGADLVYTEELIDKKLLDTARYVNNLLNTVDYVLPNGDVLLRTCSQEKNNVILQIGTCDPERAVRVAQMVKDDVAGIDVNMGCPKEFSIQGGMGAALLTKPEKVREIMTALVEKSPLPVTCKIRILPTAEQTLSLVKMIEQCGVRAIGVHGRLRETRSSQPCNTDIIKEISNTIAIPVIANGGSNWIKDYSHIKEFQSQTNASSVMVARAAQWNPSCFRKEGLLPPLEVMQAYTRLAVQYDNEFTNTKYVLCRIMQETCKTEQGRLLTHSRDMEDICVVFDLKEYYDATLRDRMKRKHCLIKDQSNQVSTLKRSAEDNTGSIGQKRQKCAESTANIYDTTIKNQEHLIADEKCLILDIVYNKNHYLKTTSPMQILLMLFQKQGREKPVFTTIENKQDRAFHTSISVDGISYTVKKPHKRKKLAEQAAAVVYLMSQGIDDGRMKGKVDYDEMVNSEELLSQLAHLGVQKATNNKPSSNSRVITLQDQKEDIEEKIA